MRLTQRLALRLPGGAGLRDRLVGPGLILAPQRNTGRFCDAVGQIDQPLFCSVFGSVTVTTPALRLRGAVPVGPHVRVRWYELPASCSTRRTVLVPTCGAYCREFVQLERECGIAVGERGRPSG